MDQDVLKFLLGNASVAGVLSVCIWWLINDRKTQQTNFDKERTVLKEIIAESTAEVKLLNNRSRDDQKSMMEFLRDFEKVIAQSDPRAPINNMGVILRRIARKVGADIDDLNGTK